MNPFDYSLCDQTVTVYRKEGEEVRRQVAENCHLTCSDADTTQCYGKSRLKTFLLIIPGDGLPLQIGDRVFHGIGPQEVSWDAFVPALVPQLYEISFVKPCYWESELIHWEASNRKEAM